MPLSIVLTSESLLRLLAESRRAGAAAGIALLGIAAVPATGGNAASIKSWGDEGGLGCISCTAPCLAGEGIGKTCADAGEAATIDGSGCEDSMIYILGTYQCFCQYVDGSCDLAQSMASADRSRLEIEAVEAVAAGRMLPGDGFFYLTWKAEDLFVRWKCDGHMAGRLAAAQTMGRTGPVVAG